MKMMKKSNWVPEENSYTYWYTCPNCGYGAYDGWGGNQQQFDFCPKCGRCMTSLVPIECDSCNKYISSTGMCCHRDMEFPFECIVDGCKPHCPKQYNFTEGQGG